MLQTIVAVTTATGDSGISTSTLDLREIITTRNDAAEGGMSANLCRRNVVVRDGPEGFTTFKMDTVAIA